MSRSRVMVITFSLTMRGRKQSYGLFCSTDTVLFISIMRMRNSRRLTPRSYFLTHRQ